MLQLYTYVVDESTLGFWGFPIKKFGQQTSFYFIHAQI